MVGLQVGTKENRRSPKIQILAGLEEAAASQPQPEKEKTFK